MRSGRSWDCEDRLDRDALDATVFGAYFISIPPTASSGQTIDSPPGPEVSIGDRRYLYFGGTGYLDVQRRPELAEAADQAMRRYGLHPATSRLGFGESPPLAEAEREAAQFFGVEAAWLLPSGWVGASVLLDVHHRPQDRLFLDRDAHFALRDAARLVGRPFVFFDHRDPEDLRAKLRSELQPGERPVVLTDGVFPISGQLAPLPNCTMPPSFAVARCLICTYS